MKKTLPILLLVLLLGLLCGTACAETYVLDEIYASIDVPETFPVVLRKDHISEYATWLSAQGKDVQTVTDDLNARGVLLQCWNETGDMCFELTATQSDRTKLIFDVNEQDTAVRGSYRLSHYPNNDYTAQGFDFTSADWKNTNNGRFLVLQYLRRDVGEVLYKGFMRRTIRNGYEITLDMQIYGRATTNKDNNQLNKIWDTFRFIEIQPMPPAASSHINITKIPPEETNAQNITMEGTAAEGVKLTAVVMGLNYPDPLLFEVTVGASGKFKMPISLPKEGVFLITVTGEFQGEEVVELAYPVTYQRTLLTINVNEAVPEVITTSDVRIQGTSVAGANIQVFLDGESVMQKRVTAAGKFLVEMKISEEGPHEIILAFSAKGLADRRLVYNFNRHWTDEDMVKKLSKEAVKPAYNTLVSKIDGYTGKIMGYRAYLLGVSQSGDGWILQMALTKNDGGYSGIIVVASKEEPTFAIGDRMMMYGTCTGLAVSASESAEDQEQEANCPSFDLLLLVSEE